MEGLFCPSRRQAAVGTGGGKPKVRGQVALRPGLAESAAQQPGLTRALLTFLSACLKFCPAHTCPESPLGQSKPRCRPARDQVSAEFSSPLQSMESSLLYFKLSRKDAASHHCITVHGRSLDLGRLAIPHWVGPSKPLLTTYLTLFLPRKRPGILLQPPWLPSRAASLSSLSLSRPHVHGSCQSLSPAEYIFKSRTDVASLH